MRGIKKLTAGLTALAIGLGMTSYSGGLRTNAEVDDCNDDWLHAVGSRLYDKDGNEVWLTGANWFGFNCGENCLHYLWSVDVDDALSTIADHGINVIRVPISTELLCSWMNGTPNPVSSVQANNDPAYTINEAFCNADGSLKDSMQIFDAIMAKCKTYGLKVILDVHSPTAHNSGHNYNLWYYDAGAGSADTMAITADGVKVTTEMWMDSLVWIADKYSNDDTIIAYDLKNEPHGKGQEGSSAAKWDGSTDENNWRYAATECANAIYAVNPNALIFVEGVEQYLRSDSFTWGQPDSESNPPYYPGWWGGQLRGVREYPVVPDNGTSQIVYSPHDYGPSVWPQTWFDGDFTTESLLNDYWYDTWAYIEAENIAPLFIGEWGGHMDDGDNQKWMELLRDYMIDNHINHTFWCLNTNSGDTGGLWTYFAFSPETGSTIEWDTEKYGLMEESLWQTTSGKYIGLDHARPLGVNDTGISVSEYYASYAASEGSNLDAGESTEPKPVETTPDATESEDPTDPPTTEEEQPATEPVADLLYGDVDLNGKVEILDVIALSKGLMGAVKLTQEQVDVSDCNADQIVNSTDALMILKYLVKIVESLG